MDNIVITIARQYGSGGKTIGAMLARDLGINCYSREILKMASEESGINEYALTLFLPDTDGRYEKVEEVHYQRAYPLEQIKTLLQSSGLKLLAVYDAYTREAPRADSGRLTFIAKEYGK